MTFNTEVALSLKNVCVDAFPSAHFRRSQWFHGPFTYVVVRKQKTDTANGSYGKIQSLDLQSLQVAVSLAVRMENYLPASLTEKTDPNGQKKWVETQRLVDVIVCGHETSLTK
jgi:hypothetical protein